MHMAEASLPIYGQIYLIGEDLISTEMQVPSNSLS